MVEGVGSQLQHDTEVEEDVERVVGFEGVDGDRRGITKDGNSPSPEMI